MNGINKIDEFLLTWKQRAFKYYTDMHKEYQKFQFADFEITADNLQEVRSPASNNQRYSNEKITHIMNQLHNSSLPKYMIENLKGQISHTKFKKWKAAYSKTEIAICERMYEKGYIDKILDKEVENKKKALIARIENKAGNILDANSLAIGGNGEINGYITGDKAKVKVQTIYAGGHNIQSLHYRVLVK